ncbi:MAG TPA: tRNA (N(6)-L-threonylcarbamoyladenosine(37)-C(2))-methylthiotransferase MtaB [Bacteroidales bacterium]|nr:tRNA (N(6)-L-threonylcarbamoyladenosine(37)-C(2))-methylthiotransferase MtaB [Bacteroidales bacterium]
MKTVAFHTLGCKLNFAESSTIIREFTDKGYRIAGFKEKADVYVIHSCMVTQQAERKCIYALRQAKMRNPEARIAVIGCMPELNAERLRKEGNDILLLGNSNKFELPDLLDSSTGSIAQKPETFRPSWSSEGRTRTFFKVQDGCDYFCGYCTIPLARGRSRSATVDETLSSIAEATAHGCKELVLSGINIGDFGKNNKETFYQLLCKITELKNISRIRLSSIEPDLTSDDIISLFAENPCFMPHFHIPLQSGSDEILKAMGRRYDTALFAEKVQKIKKLIPHACIATDVITGYPGETEKNHKETMSFIEKTDLSYMHVFTFSERKNTRAYNMENQVPTDIKKLRSHELHGLSEQKKTFFYNQNTGRICDALFESETVHSSLLGYTDNYIRIKTPVSAELVNSIRKVRTTGIDEDGICTIELL